MNQRLAAVRVELGMPQMNVMLVGFSAKILVGWPVLALTLPAMAPVMRRCFAGVFEFWELVLR